MDRTLVFLASALLFCVRDGQLIGARPALAFAFVPMLLAAGVGSGMLAETLSADEVETWINDLRWWMPAAAIHAAVCYWSGRRGRRGMRPDWISILPAPVCCVGFVLGSRFVLSGLDGGTGAAVGALFAVPYCLAAVGVAWPRRARVDSARALRFASVTHLSALLLVPAAAVLDRPLATHAIDWRSTVAVLAGVGALVGGSFLWHRLRNRSALTSKSR